MYGGKIIVDLVISLTRLHTLAEEKAAKNKIDIFAS